MSSNQDQPAAQAAETEPLTSGEGASPPPDAAAASSPSEPSPAPTAAERVPEVITIGPEEIEALIAKAAKAEDNWNHYLRARADLDNYRKRAQRERQEAVRYANIGLAEKLIPALDSFDAALAAVKSAAPGAADSLLTGIQMVHSQLRQALTEAGLQEIDALGQPFDPNLHEAVSQRETTDAPEGQVVQQLRKGYRLHERLIRPASVIVAKAPAA